MKKEKVNVVQLPGAHAITAEKLAKLLLEHPKARVYVQDSTFWHNYPVNDNVKTPEHPYGEGIKIETTEGGRERIILNAFK